MSADITTEEYMKVYTAVERLSTLTYDPPAWRTRRSFG